MIKNWRSYLCLFWMLGSLYGLRLHAQRQNLPPPPSLDTILMMKSGTGMQYYMGGRKVNLAIMEWFMHDYPTARKDISNALVADQLSVAAYSVGSLFTVTGLLVYEPNKRLGGNLMMLGGISLGTGVIFQIISGKYKKTAVRKYNAALKRPNKDSVKGTSYRPSFGVTLQGLIVRF